MPHDESGRVALRILAILALAAVGIVGTLFALDWQARSNDEVRVIEVPFLGGAGAPTTGRVIFVHAGRADDADLLAHELVHVCQWEEGGLEFLWEYTTEYISNLADLRDVDAAYREISFEEQARAGESNCELESFALPES